MSHKEFVKSISDNDGRKWLIEEVNGQSVYLEIIDERNPYATGRIKKKKDWDPYRKKLPDGKTIQIGNESRERSPFTWRLGYNHCVGQFSPKGGDYPTLSGSSLNRIGKKRIPEKVKRADGSAIHLFSRRSRGKVKDKTTAFFRSIPKDRIFVTLTFIEHIDDRRGVQILNKFLTVVRKERPGFEYIWVAEHQPLRKEKTIHFHILMNKKLAVRRYNALWTLQQYNAGLTGHRNNGEAIGKREILDRYEDGTIGEILNPAQMRRAYNVSGLASYLTAYVTKQTEDDPFGCLNWHCSRKVSKLFTREVVSPSTFAYLKSFGNYQVDKKTGECTPARVIYQQYFTMIYVHNKGAPLSRLRQMEQANKWIINHFEPDGIRRFDDALYRKIWYNEKEAILATAPDVPGRDRSRSKKRRQ